MRGHSNRACVRWKGAGGSREIAVAVDGVLCDDKSFSPAFMAACGWRSESVDAVVDDVTCSALLSALQRKRACLAGSV